MYGAGWYLSGQPAGHMWALGIGHQNSANEVPLKLPNVDSKARGMPFLGLLPTLLQNGPMARAHACCYKIVASVALLRYCGSSRCACVVMIHTCSDGKRWRSVALL